MPFEPGTKVRVINPHHWLFDKVGHVIPVTLDGMVKKQLMGAPRSMDVGMPIDFGRHHHGWYDTPLTGERAVTTHYCDGALSRPHGYYMLERDLRIEDVSGGRRL